MALKSKLSFDEEDDGAAEAVAPAAPGLGKMRAPGPAGPGPGSGGTGEPPAKRKVSLAERLKEAQRLREAEAAGAGDGAGDGEGAGEGPSRKRPRVGKNPDVNTDFLPDKEREETEAETRARLARQWEAEQERVRSEPIDMRYSYFDGTGHGYTLQVKKGDTIGAFLQRAKEQLGSAFREVSASSSSSLMYVKDDYIIPHDVTFYDLMMKRVPLPGGKEASLFRFHDTEFTTVGPDGRARKESNADAAKMFLAKVVDRHYYSRHKHAHPANRWEPYDPTHPYEEKHLWRREGKFAK